VQRRCSVAQLDLHGQAFSLIDALDASRCIPAMGRRMTTPRWDLEGVEAATLFVPAELLVCLSG
jgi:hypothetical protein